MSLSSFLHDVLKFEKFNLKDMWKKIKKDPERILLGAMDPFSTRVWNQTDVGKDWEPVVDQWGGAYGGQAAGGGTGGVYGRAEAAGVPTEAGGAMHGLARTIAGAIAGNYGASKMPDIGSKLTGGKVSYKPNFQNLLSANTQPAAQPQPWLVDPKKLSDEALLALLQQMETTGKLS